MGKVAKVVGSAFGFLVLSIVAGCLVAGLALPFATVSVFAARGVNDAVSHVSASLYTPRQPQRSKLLAADGRVIGYFYDQNRVYVPLRRIAPIMQEAMVSIEDARYYAHGALDLKGTVRALAADILNGGTVQGGSTLTQQYVKQVLVNRAALSGDQRALKDATADTFARKITELRYAVSVEHRLSKAQILERYLNIAYYGDGAYGVEAAAEHYFGTTAAKLTLPQAAMLAGLVQSPDAYDPVTYPQVGLGRRNEVLARMAELGVITPSQAASAEQKRFVKSRVVSVPSGCVASPYPFVCDYAVRSLLQAPSLGSSLSARENALRRDGLTIRTTLDESVQRAAQNAITKIIGPRDPVIAVTDVVQPGTGQIKAMAQSRPVMGSAHGETYYNYSAPASMGGAEGFQAGSTFKSFTVAAAFTEGIPMSHRIKAPATKTYTGQRFKTCHGTSKILKWTVHNSTGVNGNMNMLRGAEFSVNNYFVQLELQVGMCNVIRMAENLGAQTNTVTQPISSYVDKPSFTLGTAEVNPLSMAGVFATFAAGGVHCDPVIVDKITTASGADLAAPSAGCRRAISADVANAINDLFSHVISAGTGLPAQTADRRPQAGKTGTIDSNAAVWFDGYTPNAEATSMIAVDKTRKPFILGKPSYISTGLKYYTVPSTGVLLSGTGGGDAGHDLWRPTMNHYLRSLPVQSFNPPPQRLVNPRPHPVPTPVTPSPTPPPATPAQGQGG